MNETEDRADDVRRKPYFVDHYPGDEDQSDSDGFSSLQRDQSQDAQDPQQSYGSGYDDQPYGAPPPEQPNIAPDQQPSYDQPYPQQPYGQPSYQPQQPQQQQQQYGQPYPQQPYGPAYPQQPYGPAYPQQPFGPGYQPQMGYGGYPPQWAYNWRDIPQEQGWFWVFFSFKGRLERARYIMGSFITMAVIIGMWVGGIIWMGELREEQGIIMILGLLGVSLLFVIPDAAMAMKRLRDLDEEPLLVFLFILLPLLPCIGGLCKLVMWIWLMAAKGTEGPNQYGPLPLGR